MARIVLIAVTLALGAAAPAQAGWFPAAPIDSGTFSSVDVARDGSAAITYVKDGHPMLVRMAAGAPQPPEVLDAGAGSSPAVAVSDGGALVVAWRAGDRIIGRYSDGGPLSPPVELGAGQVGAPQVDMAIQRTAYVVFSQAGDVRAVRLRKGLWEPAPAPMDIDASRSADAPRVAVAADGNAVVVWSEGGSLWARRLTDLRLSALPQEIAAGASGADLQIEDDVSFAWVTYLQDGRAYARRLVGSLFDPAVPVDLGPGTTAASVSMNGDGVGLAAAQTGGDIGVAPLVHDAFGPAVKVGSGSTPLVAGAESRDLAVVWKTPSGWVGRHAAKDELPEPEAPLGVTSDVARLSSDRSGDMLLGGGVGGSVVAAVWDEPPSAARLRTNRAYKRLRRPLLRWGMGLDLWGGQTFRVIVDGAVVGTTTKESLTSPRLKDGAHKWQVVSVDARGQGTPSKPRYVRVDRSPPRVTLRKRPGRRLRVILRDRLAGVRSARTDFGDGTVTRSLSPGEHRYARSAGYRVTVRAEDAAGNVANKRFTVRVG